LVTDSYIVLTLDIRLLQFSGEWKVIHGLSSKHKVHNAKCCTLDYQLTKDAVVIGYSAKLEDGKAMKGQIYGQPLFGESSNSSMLQTTFQKPDGKFSGKSDLLSLRSCPVLPK